jgi:hypothetical protein
LLYKAQEEFIEQFIKERSVPDFSLELADIIELERKAQEGIELDVSILEFINLRMEVKQPDSTQTFITTPRSYLFDSQGNLKSATHYFSEEIIPNKLCEPSRIAIEETLIRFRGMAESLSSKYPHFEEEMKFLTVKRRTLYGNKLEGYLQGWKYHNFTQQCDGYSVNFVCCLNKESDETCRLTTSITYHRTS